MQFWLVGFGLSLAKTASENFRHFSGKKLQIEIDSERTEPVSTLLTNIKEYGHTEILKSKRADVVLVPYCLSKKQIYTVKNRAQFLKREKREDLLFVLQNILTSLIKCDDVIIYYTSSSLQVCNIFPYQY